MPNIEIRGLPKAAAKKLRKEVFALFDDREYVNEMVVSVETTDVEDRKGEKQPFFRLANSCQKHSGEIVRRLQKAFNMDVEHLVLKKFYPKRRI